MTRNTIPRQRSFLFLLFNQFFIQLAHAVFDISLIWLALEITGSNAGSGLVMATAYLPFLLFSLPAGLLADRWSKARIMKISSFLRIAVALIIPIGAALNNPGLFFIAAAAFLLTSVSVIYLPARDSLLPEYVEGAQLLKANSLVQGSVQLAYITGPILAGFLIEILGNIHIFLISSLLFLFASTISLGMENTRRAESSSTSLRRRELLDVFQLLNKDKRLLWIIAITMIDNLFIMGPAILGVAVFVKSVLLGSASDYALSESFLAAGMVAGTLVLLRFGKNIPLGWMLIIGIIMDGLTYVPVYFIQDIHWLWLTIFVHALFIPMITVSRTTLIQNLVPKNMHGRVFSLISISVIGFTAISSALTGWISDIIPIAELFLLIGSAAALTGLIAAFYKPLRILK